MTSTTSKHLRALTAAASLCAFACAPEADLSIDTTELALAPPGADAMLFDHDIPATMALGETRRVMIVVFNSGTVPWDHGDWVLSDRGDGVWAPSAISVAPPVNPGEIATFSFLLTAPSVEGPFLVRGRMKLRSVGYFGAPIDVPVTVNAVASGPLDSVLVSDNVPVALFPGEKRRVHVVFRNAGTQTWNASFDLRRAGGGQLGWVSTPIAGVVPQNGQYDFSFVIKAPAEEGTNRLFARLYYGGLFGEALDVPVDVSSAVTPERWWAEAGDTVPELFAPGQRSEFTITVRNTGSLPWSGNTWALQVDSTPRVAWARGVFRLGAGETVLPGETRVFNVGLNAPASLGSLGLRWEMTELGVEGVERFGPVVSVPITVGVPPAVDTFIDAGPANPSCQANPELVFSADAPAANFECSLDSAPWAPCVSPYAIGPLADGPHDFVVRAVLDGVPDATPAQRAWILDTANGNWGFEEDYSCWTIAESDPGNASTWGIATHGETITSGQEVYDFGDGVMVAQTSPGLPKTYSATEGNKVGFMLVGGALLHRVYRDTTLPACATSLAWDMEYRNHNAGWSDDQYLAVTLRNPVNDAVLETFFYSDVEALVAPMQTYTGALSAYAGQVVRIDVEANIFSFYLDLTLDNFRVLCD